MAPRLEILSTLLLVALVPNISDAASGIASMRWLNPGPQGNSVEALAFESGLVGYGVGLEGTSMRTTDGGNSWLDLSDPLAFSTDFLDLEVLGPGDLLAVGSGAGIYRSTDAGESWHVVANPSTGRLTHLGRIDETTLSAVGDDGQRLLSIDNGASWALGTSTGLDYANGQTWLTSAHGWVLGRAWTTENWSGVVETTDGGASWSPVILDGTEYFDIQFTDASNGWLCEVFSMFRTTDGGATWTPMPFTPVYLNTQLIDSNTHRILICAGEGAEIYETLDDGVTWTPLYQRFGTLSYTDIHRLPDGRVVVASSDGDLLYSDDDGQSWTNTTDGPGDDDRFDLWRVRRLADGRGYAFGYDGDWLRTADDGESWIREPSPISSFAPQMEFWDDDMLGLAGGVGSGTILSKTTDGGTTWSPRTVSSTFSGSPAGIEFVDHDVIWVAFQGTAPIRVFRSTDAGETWEPRAGGIPTNAGIIDCISFVDADHGFIGGDWLTAQSKLLRTTDGGLNWSPVSIPDFISPVWDTHWTSIDHGFIATRFGVFETTDGGANWTTPLAADAYKMFWADAMHGCVMALVSSSLQLTRDGGQTWSVIEMPWGNGILSVEWIAGDRLWISSYGSRILDVTLFSPADVPDEAESGHPFAVRGVLRVLGQPARDQVTLDLRAETGGSAKLSWYDAAGRRLAESTHRLTEGTNRIELAVPGGKRSAVLFLQAQLPDGTRASRRIVALR
jgi:photosystem II stability/assembly factor-like uncharacterized protein